MYSKSYLNFMTEREYMNLPYWGRTLAEYWTEFLPKMCQAKKKQGTLLQELEEEGMRLLDLQDRLIQKGYPYDVSIEYVKEELYSLPPEK